MFSKILWQTWITLRKINVINSEGEILILCKAVNQPSLKKEDGAGAKM